MQHDVVGRHCPANALDLLLGHAQSKLLHDQHDLLAAPCFRNRAHIASLEIDEVFDGVEHLVLTLNHANVTNDFSLIPRTHVVALVVVEPKAVALTLDRVVAVREEAGATSLQILGVVFVVEQGNVLPRHPLSDEYVVPRVGVVLFRVRVDHHVLRIELVDTDLARHAVGEIQTYVQKPTAGDDAVAEHVRALPVELVGVANLSKNFR